MNIAILVIFVCFVLEFGIGVYVGRSTKSTPTIRISSSKSDEPMIHHTPVDDSALSMYDDLPFKEAVSKAWDTGGEHIFWHQQCVDEVHKCMPVLAHILDHAKEFDE